MASDDKALTRHASALARILESDAHWTRGMDNRTLVGAYAAALAALLNEMEELDLAVRYDTDGDGMISWCVHRPGYATSRSVGWDDQEAKWVVLK